MLTRILEPSYNEPFYFLYITAKDVSTSNGKGRSEFTKFLLHVNKMKPMPKFIALCGGAAHEQSSIEDDFLARKRYLEEELSCLDQRIKVLYVASSDDFKGHLNGDCIDKYRFCFGDDWYEFWVCGIGFLVINTVYFKKQIDDGLAAMRDEQIDWIESQLLQQQIFQAKRTIVLQDRIPCRKNCDDDERDAEDSEVDMLEELLLKYKIAGVSHLLCREKTLFEKDESERCGFEVLPNETNVSESWFVRLVKISSDEVYHESYTLKELPEQVYL